MGATCAHQIQPLNASTRIDQVIKCAMNSKISSP